MLCTTEVVLRIEEVQTPTALAPAKNLSIASFPSIIPPMPIIGIFTDLANSIVHPTANSLIAAPETAPRPIQ
jgi:hypothetical protein